MTTPLHPVRDAIEARGWPWYLTGSEALAAYGRLLSLPPGAPVTDKGPYRDLAS